MIRKKGNNKTIKLVWDDLEVLSLAAAHRFLTACNKSIANQGVFSVALSGGSTPKRLYELLSTPGFSRNIDWKKVLLFWGDERLVPHSHPDSNYRMVKETLLEKIKIPKKNIFPIPTRGRPQDCALEYEKRIKAALGRSPSFDLMLLGMGDDGHTASLFPGTSILTENKKLVKEVWVEGKQSWRISCTYPLINRSKDLLLLVAGSNKAPVIKRVFSTRQQKNPFPVEGLQLRKGTITWLIDEAANGGS